MSGIEIGGDWAAKLGPLPAMAAHVGIVYHGSLPNGAEGGAPVLAMPFTLQLMGRPGFLQGGATASLLEIAGLVGLRAVMLDRHGEEAMPRVKPINVTIDYLRGGEAVTSYASARITRMGRSLANVEAFGWQASVDEPIAIAQMHYLVG
jgi:acyl-coenzyme A thioesterase PaaI-like protein